MFQIIGYLIISPYTVKKNHIIFHQRCFTSTIVNAKANPARVHNLQVLQNTRKSGNPSNFSLSKFFRHFCGDKLVFDSKDICFRKQQNWLSNNNQMFKSRVTMRKWPLSVISLVQQTFQQGTLNAVA